MNKNLNETAREITYKILVDQGKLERFPLNVFALKRLRKNLTALSKIDLNDLSDENIRLFGMVWWSTRDLHVALHNLPKAKRLASGSIWHLHNTLKATCKDQYHENMIAKDHVALSRTTKPFSWDLNLMWGILCIFLIWSLTTHVNNVIHRINSPYTTNLLISNIDTENASATDAFLIKINTIQNPTVEEVSEVVDKGTNSIDIEIFKDGMTNTLTIPVSTLNGVKRIELEFHPTLEESLTKITWGIMGTLICSLLLFPLNSSLGFLNGPLTLFINVVALLYFSPQLLNGTATAYGYIGFLVPLFYLYISRWAFVGIDPSELDLDNPEYPEFSDDQP